MENEAGETASKRAAHVPGILGAVITLLLIGAVIYFREFIHSLGGYGYLGAFLISIFGGATVIVPVPMLPVVFALGGIMKYPMLVGVAAALGEIVGALIIYMTGYGGGTLLHDSRYGKFQAFYLRVMRLMERKGSLTLFVLSSVVNPFFYPAALAAGASRFSLPRYLLICSAGKTIKGMTVAYAGYWGLGGLFRMLGISV